jgi:maltose/moltooligosaccharide transporter
VGSVIAALLPWVLTNWAGLSNTADAGKIPDSVKWSFYLGGAVFLISVLYTVFTTDEFPPENLEKFKEENKKISLSEAVKESFGGIVKMPKTMAQLAIVQFFTWFALFAMWIYSTNAVTATKYNMKVDQSLVTKMEAHLKKSMDTTTDKKALKGLKGLQKDIDEIRTYRANENPVTISVNLANYFADNKFVTDSATMAEIVKVLAVEPTKSKQYESLNKEYIKRQADLVAKVEKPEKISPANFVYFMELAKKHNTLQPTAVQAFQETASLKSVQVEYNNGADWLNVCSSVRNGVAAVFAFLIPFIAARTNRRITHLICLVIGGIGLLSIYFVSNPTLIVISMALVGIAWASILSMPYAMLANALPANKMGYYMGVFNFFIVIPQMVAAGILGFFTMKVFGANTLNTIALGGASMILAGILTLFVKDND